MVRGRLRVISAGRRAQKASGETARQRRGCNPPSGIEGCGTMGSISLKPNMDHDIRRTMVGGLGRGK